MTGAVNLLIDISERKRVEADLAELTAQLAVFVEHAPVAIAMFDRQMRYLAVPRRFVVDYRLPQDAQLIGRSHYEIFPARSSCALRSARRASVRLRSLISTSMLTAPVNLPDSSNSGVG